MGKKDTDFEGAAKGDNTPLGRNSFAQEFVSEGDTIRYHERYALHARKILADERNYLGLFALDCVEENKKTHFRLCDITPSKNHPLLLFFQFQIFHEADKLTPNSKDKFLPDRPDLDKILALLHDEGEDSPNFTKDDLEQKLNFFINNMGSYVDQHNKKYAPHINIPMPSPRDIEKMRSDIPAILQAYDALTHSYYREEEV